MTKEYTKSNMIDFAVAFANREKQGKSTNPIHALNEWENEKSKFIEI